MPKPLCAECYLQDYCRNLQSRIVAVSELTPDLIADVRRTMRAICISRDGWKPYLIDGYQNYPGRVVDGVSREVWLDTSVFDAANIRYWFRDLLRELPQGARPRIRKSARARFIFLASILRALHPVRASLWGKTVANDEEAALPPLIHTAGCRYPHFAYLPERSG